MSANQKCALSSALFGRVAVPLALKCHCELLFGREPKTKLLSFLLGLLVECILNRFIDYSFFFLPRSRVDPGLICSILTRPRSIFLMMPSTVAVQMKGFGCSFQLRINSSIACFKSGTLTKLARLIALSLNSLHQRSPKFSQLELVGMKWLTNRGCFFSHACTCGSLWVP
jgi:hypothetical protein